MGKNRVVIVSPYFPPSTLAGVHRARLLAKYLPEHGWCPTVVCVDEAFHEQTLDPGLAALLPSDLDVRKVRAIPTAIARPMGLGEISLRAWLPLRRAIHSATAEADVRAVLITGSPFYPMLLAGEIQRRFGVPVVLDFQDPWASEWGAKQALLSKAGVAHRLAKTLEPRALRGASHVTTVSMRQCDNLARRYGWLDRSAITDIPIGIDPDDLVALRADAGCNDANLPGSDSRFTIAYVGTIWPPVMPTLRTLLRGVAKLRASNPDAYKRLRLNFVGTTSNPSEATKPVVMPMAVEEGVADVVEEIPRRIPYLTALSITANADANLVLGSDEPHYTASKIYGLLLADRPHLSLMRVESSAHAVCKAAGGGIALSFASAEELPRLIDPVAHAIHRLVMHEPLGPIDQTVCVPYHAGAIAGRFASVFNQIIS